MLEAIHILLIIFFLFIFITLELFILEMDAQWTHCIVLRLNHIFHRKFLRKKLATNTIRLIRVLIIILRLLFLLTFSTIIFIVLIASRCLLLEINIVSRPIILIQPTAGQLVQLRFLPRYQLLLQPLLRRDPALPRSHRPNSPSSTSTDGLTTQTAIPNAITVRPLDFHRVCTIVNSVLRAFHVLRIALFPSQDGVVKVGLATVQVGEGERAKLAEVGHGLLAEEHHRVVLAVDAGRAIVVAATTVGLGNGGERDDGLHRHLDHLFQHLQVICDLVLHLGLLKLVLGLLQLG